MTTDGQKFLVPSLDSCNLVSVVPTLFQSCRPGSCRHCFSRVDAEKKCFQLLFHRNITLRKADDHESATMKGYRKEQQGQCPGDVLAFFGRHCFSRRSPETSPCQEMCKLRKTESFNDSGDSSQHQRAVTSEWNLPPPRK